MSYKLIPANSIHFQDGYNDIVRSPKEFKANAADVERSMEAQGDDPSLFPIRFVTIDGKKYTRNHSTLQAALNREWKEVLAMPSPHEPGSLADLLDLVMSNNGGHPLSRVAQGKLYAKLRDGERDEEAEAKATKEAKIGEEVKEIWLRTPMTEKEIGDACKPAYSGEHVRQCILLAESSPEVGALIEEDKVALNIVIAAKSLAKDDDAKQLRILKKAVANAKDDGKERATMKHFDAIKAEFKPVAKLKAAGKNGETATTEAPGASGKPADDETDTQPPKLPVESPTTEQPTLKLEPEILKEDSKKAGKLKGAWKTILMEPDNLEETTLDEETVDALVEKIYAAMVAANEVF